MTLTASIEEMTDDSTVEAIRAETNSAEDGPTSTAKQPRTWPGKVSEWAAKKMGYRHLHELLKHRGDLHATFEGIPSRMHLAANQMQLMLELVEDFRSGTYREVSWRSLVIATGALLYVVSPVDVVPDVFLALGKLDDLAIMAFAARVLRKELEHYCEFKGYAKDKYFSDASAQAPATAQA